MQSWRAIGLGSSESREDSEVQEEMPRAQERPQENGRDGRSSFSAPTEGKIGLYTPQKKIPVGAQCGYTPNTFLALSPQRGKLNHCVI